MWQSLGQNVAISQYEWVLLDPPITNVLGSDTGLFTISQDWNASNHPKGFLWLASYFPDIQAFSLFQSIKPRKGGIRLIDVPVPDSYVRAGLLTRQIAIKPDDRTYWYGESNWTVSMQYYEPDGPTEQESLLQEVDQARTDIQALTQQVAGLKQAIAELQASMN